MLGLLLKQSGIVSTKPWDLKLIIGPLCSKHPGLKSWNCNTSLLDLFLSPIFFRRTVNRIRWNADSHHFFRVTHISTLSITKNRWSKPFILSSWRWFWHEPRKTRVHTVVASKIRDSLTSWYGKCLMIHRVWDTSQVVVFLGISEASTSEGRAPIFWPKLQIWEAFSDKNIYPSTVALVFEIFKKVAKKKKSLPQCLGSITKKIQEPKNRRKDELKIFPSLKLTFSPRKMVETPIGIFSFSRGLFSGVMLVSESVTSVWSLKFIFNANFTQTIRSYYKPPYFFFTPKKPYGFSNKKNASHPGVVEKYNSTLATQATSYKPPEQTTDSWL